MRTYLITYDIAAKTRHAVSGVLMQLGEAWARPLENTWYVQSSERAGALENHLKALLDGEDGLLIQRVDAEPILSNTALRWFRRRKPDPADVGNVIVFPLADVSEAKAA